LIYCLFSPFPEFWEISITNLIRGHSFDKGDLLAEIVELNQRKEFLFRLLRHISPLFLQNSNDPCFHIFSLHLEPFLLLLKRVVSHTFRKQLHICRAYHNFKLSDLVLFEVEPGDQLYGMDLAGGVHLFEKLRQESQELLNVEFFFNSVVGHTIY
jgi:hypothetical protein